MWKIKRWYVTRIRNGEGCGRSVLRNVTLLDSMIFPEPKAGWWVQNVKPQQWQQRSKPTCVSKAAHYLAIRSPKQRDSSDSCSECKGGVGVGVVVVGERRKFDAAKALGEAWPAGAKATRWEQNAKPSRGKEESHSGITENSQTPKIFSSRARALGFRRASR